MGRVLLVLLLSSFSGCSSTGGESGGPLEAGGVCTQALELGEERCSADGEALEACEAASPGECEALEEVWVECRDGVVGEALGACELETAEECESLGRKAAAALAACVFTAGDCELELEHCASFEQ